MSGKHVIRALAISLLCCWCRTAAGQSATDTAPSTPNDASPASAESEAQRLFEDGVALASEQRYAMARTAFEESLAQVERPSTLLNLSIVLYQLGEHRAAVSRLDRLLELLGDTEPVREEQAHELRRKAMTHLAELTVAVEPTAAQVVVDDRELRSDDTAWVIVLDPGVHRVVATAPGYTPKTVELDLIAGERKSVRLDLESRPRRSTKSAIVTSPRSAASETVTADRQPRPYPLVVIGGGLATLVAGGVTGGLALREDRRIADECPTRTNCPESLQRVEDRRDRFELAANTLFGIGAVATAAGAITWGLERRRARRPANETSSRPLRIGLGPTALTVTGKF